MAIDSFCALFRYFDKIDFELKFSRLAPQAILELPLTRICVDLTITNIGHISLSDLLR